jgi:stage III sporulation protein SpoIIIAA
MKSLKEILEDSVLDIEGALKDGDRFAAEKEFNEMFYCSILTPGKMSYTISNKPNRDGKYEIRVKVKKGAELCVNNKYFSETGANTLEAKYFILKRVDGKMEISTCPIINLKGSPEIVNGDYRVAYCSNLQSYEGIPKKVTNCVSFSKNGKYFSRYDIEKVCDAGLYLC